LFFAEKWFQKGRGFMMKKLIYLISTVATLAGLSAQAATLQEWNFYSDPAGKPLSQAINSKGAASFAAGSETRLRTDGFGNMLCTQEDTGTTGMWTNGAILNAVLSSDITSGVQFLRYDFAYDLSDIGSLNDSGCVVGFSFHDQTGGKVAGVALQYDVGAVTGTPYQVTELTEMTNTVGTVAVIAKIDLDEKTLKVWYDLNGNVSGFSSNSPMHTVSNLTLNSFDSLGFQATGDIQPSTSTDQVEIALLRTADAWADIVATAMEVTDSAKYANEWTFERDVDGRPLSDTINSGTNAPLAHFSNGGTDVFTTNRALICAGEDTTGTGVWTNGAILDAALPSSTSGVHYLRYDVDYSLTNSLNDSGTLLGVYFTGDAGDKAAGLVMGYDTGNLENSKPANRTLTAVSNGLPQSGTLTAIVEVDLNATPATLKVWYGLNGSNPTNYADAITNSISLTSITNLRFHATGDFRPDGSTDYAAIDNIRHTIGTTAGNTAWTEILEQVDDSSALPVLNIFVSNSHNGSMDLNETNIVTVVISNSISAGPATAVTSTLTHDGAASAFTIISNNTPPVALAAGESVTNTYEMVAIERESCIVTVTGISDKTNSVPETFSLAAGRNLEILPVTDADIEQVSGGSYSGLYERGETLKITVTTTNNGAATVANTVNRLTVPSGFSVTAMNSQNYGSLAVGAFTSTVYQVVIGSGVSLGTYTFYVTNTAGSLSWSDSFSLDVSTRLPGADSIKANNNDNLNDNSSWIDGAAPEASNLAVFTTNITSALTNNLGANLSWRGIALVSNTAAWTISGTNTLSTSSAGIDLSQAQANLTIASPLALASKQTWNVATSRTLTVSGQITGTNTSTLVKSGEGTLVITNTANAFRGDLTVSNGTLSVANNNVLGKGTLTLNGSALATTANALLTNSIVLANAAVFNNTNDLTLSGVISGSGSLTKTGSGILALSGINTYSGGTTNSGVIEVNSNNNLGTGSLTLNSGSTLQSATVSSFSTSGGGIQSAITLAGDATIQTRNTTGADVIRVDGNISGPGQLTLAKQQIVFYGNNTFSGGLVLSHGNWFRFNGPQSLGSGDITTTGGNRLMLALAGGNITNNFILNTGMLRLNLNNQAIELSGTLSGAGNLDLEDNNGTSLILSGANTNWSGSIINVRGAKTIYIKNPNALGKGNITLGGNYNAQINLVFDTDISSGNGLTNNMKFGTTYNTDTGIDTPIQFTANQNVKMSGNLSDWDANNFTRLGVLKTGPARMTIAGSATYSGPTKVAGGTLEVTGSLLNDLTVQANGTLSGSGTVGNATLESAGILQLQAGETLNMNGTLSAGNGSLIVLPVLSTASYARLAGNGGNAAQLGGTLRLDFTGSNVQAGDVFQVLPAWGQLTDAGITVAKLGLRGDLQLDTSNLFINGTVALAPFTIVEPPRLPGDIVKADNSDALNLPSSWNGGVVPGEGNRAVFDPTILLPLITDLGADQSWRGIGLVSNNVQWTISGNNRLTIGAGGIDLSEARADLTISSKLRLGTSQIWNVATGRVLAVSGLISGTNTASLVKSGAGTLSISGAEPNTYAGRTIINDGVLSVAGTNVLGQGVLTLNGSVLATDNGALLANSAVLTNEVTVNNNHSLTLSGQISGDGSLTKTGAGALFLAGTNTYTGGTINSGFIQIGSPQSLSSGSVVMKDSSTLYAFPPAFLTGSTMNNNFELTGAATFTNIFGSAGLMSFDGNITGTGSLKLSGYQFYLRGNNTFSGGLNLDHSNWLWFEDGSLGTGPITTMRSVILRAIGNAGIANNITMNHVFRLNSDNGTLTVSGPMSGSGQLQVIDNTGGPLEISGDNSGRTGTTLHRGGGLRLGHRNALGSGEIQIQPQFVNFSFEVSTELTGANSLANPININAAYPDTGTGLFIPISFNLNHDLELSGRFYSSIGELAPIEKNGPGALILSGSNEYLNPINVNAGSLVVNNTVLSEKITLASGTTLAGTGFVQAVTLNSNSKLDLSGGGMTFGGDLMMGNGVTTRLSVKNSSSALRGNGGNTLTAKGTLKLDFSNTTVTLGDTFTIFSNWGTRIDNGLQVFGTNLPEFTKLDTSDLFINGTVQVVQSDRISTQMLEITVPQGGTASGSLMIRNSTGGSLSFSIPDEGDRLPADYQVTLQGDSMETFNPPQFDTSPPTVFTNWNGTSTVSTNIGFEFCLFGTEYNTFSVSRYGTVTLSTGNGATAAVLKPFGSTTPVDEDTVRYKKLADRLVIAWGNGSGQEFQAWLYDDGTIRYLYQYGTWGSGTIGLQDADYSQSIVHTPGQTANDSLLLTPASWITNDPVDGSLAGQASRTITFTADATRQQPGEFFCPATVIWGDGQEEQIAIFVTVTDQTAVLELPPSFSFSGPAGFITSTTMTINNSGNAPLNYLLTDSGLQGSGYTWTNMTYGWQGLSLSSAQLGTPLDIGFPFVYFGNVYTSLIVNVNGTLTLGSGQTISPFGANLSLDANAAVRVLADPGFSRFTVTWENMKQSGGSADQTFQAVLNRDGVVRFNYKQLGSGWSNGVIRLSDASGSVYGTLSNASTMVTTTTITPIYSNKVEVTTIGQSTFIVTNSVKISETTNVVTTYKATANNQALEFTPGQRRIISASPVTGTIPAGGTADILITGDARSLTGGGVNGVVSSTILTFGYSGQYSDVPVTFTALNSTETDYPAVNLVTMENMWGADPVVSSQQNPDGSRTLSWPAADDGLPRTYTVWYTTSLSSSWISLTTIVNGTDYLDSAHSDVPVIFYKVTVE
jgi:autotransporter-associated beta strand protein